MPTGVDARIAVCGEGELAAVAALIGRTFADEMSLDVADRLGPELAELRSRSGSGPEMVLVAEADRELAGTIVLRAEPAAGPEASGVSWLVVAPRWRQRGIGRALLARALEDCRARRVPLVRARCLAVSPAPARLYWEFGFRVVALASVSLGGRPSETIIFEKRLATPPASA